VGVDPLVLPPDLPGFSWRPLAPSDAPAFHMTALRTAFARGLPLRLSRPLFAPVSAKHCEPRWFSEQTFSEQKLYNRFTLH